MSAHCPIDTGTTVLMPRFNLTASVVLYSVLTRGPRLDKFRTQLHFVNRRAARRLSLSLFHCTFACRFFTLPQATATPRWAVAGVAAMSGRCTRRDVQSLQ